ncbi:hypothetical protein MMG85_03545 [Pseudoxanthomonas sp. LH2527]|uniref:prealbumin-like fold domain-containing protein n=1 Tax=Pseudoxanthomonas sp. LH2527 TaxID=2923249 RepID=UPI001F12D7BE|nr:hypothetical protein [Pseudoxanthomonas sp. LH2527]MCH6482646.1 hypothetical protein [Pseudoxanthomonas sp. LH2527]
MRNRGSRRIWLGIAVAAMSGSALAQAGITVDADAYEGTIGTDKGVEEPLQCPTGTMLTGIRHVDKGNGGTPSTFGMTSQLDLYCSTVTSDGNSVMLTPVAGGTAPTVLGPSYSFPGTQTIRKCPAGQVIKEASGYDRNTAGAAWMSQLQSMCIPLVVDSADWIEFAPSGFTVLTTGVLEGNASHTYRGPFCAASEDTLVSAYQLQLGGEGYDGANVHCGRLAQARFSAAISFSDYRWSTWLGGTGWRVDLRRDGVLVDDGGDNDGAGRTPHDGVGANINEYQSAREIYVVPGSGYSAVISQAPSQVDSRHYTVTGDCLGDGIALANEQDRSCTLNLNGRPDIAVSVVPPESPYTAYGQSQSLTVIAQNLGPGQVVAGDGFRVVVSLPLHWSVAGALPVGCTASDSRTITCALTTTLVGSAWPDEGGGSRSFTIPVRPNSPASAGSHTITATLDTAVPHAGNDLGNDDYDASNDTESVALELQGVATLTVAKTWIDATPTQAVTVSVTGSPSPAGGAALSSVADTPNETDTGPTPYGVAPGNSYTLTETFNSGASSGYARQLTCTGNTGTGAALAYTANALSGVLTVGSTATSIVCTFANTRLVSRLRLQKALPDGRVLPGDQFALSMTGPGSPANVTTTGSGSTATGTLTHADATPGSVYTLSETAAATTNLSSYATTYSCTNALPGGQTPSGSGTSFNITPVAGDDLTCVFSNRPRVADVSILKTASAPTVQSGQQVQFTLQIDNAGPAAADGARIQDPATPGLNCSALTCSASGSAACPSSPTVTGLQTAPGLEIPALPDGGRLTLVLTCTVTASGW